MRAPCRLLYCTTGYLQSPPTSARKGSETSRQRLSSAYLFDQRLREAKANYDGSQLIAENALTILINLSHDDEVLGNLAQDDVFLETLLKKISVRLSVYCFGGLTCAEQIV